MHVYCDFSNNNEMIFDKTHGESVTNTMDRRKSGSLTRSMKIGDALTCVVERALREDRLIVGVLEVATFLKSSGDGRTMCCILQQTSGSCSNNVQLKLIEAYCREHSVRLVKVDKYDQLVNRIYKTQSPETINMHKESNKCVSAEPKPEMDTRCILVQTPTDPTTEDDFLMAYHDMYNHCMANGFPCIKLPS